METETVYEWNLQKNAQKYVDENRANLPKGKAIGIGFYPHTGIIQEIKISDTEQEAIEFLRGKYLKDYILTAII